MTCLLVDIGNSRLKWASLAGGVLSPATAVPHQGRDMGSVLNQAWAHLPRPSRVHVACVLPEAQRQALADWVHDHWACALNWAVSASEALGVRTGYDAPAQLGVDRWLALVGAWRRTRGATCVVDCGTAVTLDIIDASGQHLGGWISPGLTMMRTALQTGTDLPRVHGSGCGGPERNTRDAIRTGTLQAIAGLVARGMQYAPEASRLLLTGGDAAQLASQLQHPYEIYPDLVLEGLAGILEGV